jgi:hypothetical protein
MLYTSFKPAGALGPVFRGAACSRATPTKKSKASRQTWCAVALLLLATTFSPARSFAQKSPAQKPVQPQPPSGLQIVSSSGEPELRVDGVPFFIHAAQFDYFRIPADLWFRSLDRYRELGINTIDLRIPWNWHEIRDAEFDFDGHTNPRRNLRGLLQLIAEKHLRLIVRPGPLIGDHWRNAGYPAWLLKYSDYKMEESAIRAGLAPLDAELATRDGNSAARDWLANQIHMTYARRWMTAIARELAPYSSTNTLQISEPGEREGETQTVDASGPLLLVIVDDLVSIPAGTDTTGLAPYLSELRRGLKRGGLNAATCVIAPNIAAQGSRPLFTTIAAQDPEIVGLTGEWLFQPWKDSREGRAGGSPPELRDGARLTTRDASSLAFLANSLSVQPDFPPLLSNFATTTFAPADDSRVPEPALENMLLASRLMLGNGVRGFTYTPLQDTLTPAGWAAPSAARFFRWDAPLDLAGNPAPLAIEVMRNGQLISAWSAMLASSHPRADFGVVNLGAFFSSAPAGEDAVSGASRSTEQIFRVAQMAGYIPELLNPAAQSVERLLRNHVILLPVPEGDANRLVLSEKAQMALVQFVRRGGVLIYFPARPAGSLLEPLWKLAPTESAEREGHLDWSFEGGRVIASKNDFYSWVSLTDDLARSRSQPEAPAAIEGLTSLLARAGAPQSLHRTGGASNPELFVSELVSNQDSASSARPHACVEEQLCAAALVSITNFSPDLAAEESFEITEPEAQASGAAGARIALDVTIPAHESLLLPVHAPLCSAAVEERCTDEVISSGAELLSVERDGKTLELAFYAPARATVRLRLESQPTKVEFGENFRAENQWKQETGELEFTLLRGAAPDYRRVVQIHLHYTPHVAEKSDSGKKHRQASEYDVFDSLRLPLASDASIPTGPPLILTGPAGGHLTISSWNRSDNLRSVDFNLDGAFRGSVSGRAFPGELMFSRLRFEPNRSPGTTDAAPIAGTAGLLQGELTLRSGRERGSVPVLFVAANEAGITHYQYDFDRDGEPEWVLESDRLRLIVSPADAGRALALVDKSTNDDLITLGGAFRDVLAPEAATLTRMPHADFALNRAYRAKWIEEKQGTGLQLDFSEHENSSAGLQVEKILRLTAPETVEASYRVSWVAAPFAPAGHPGPEKVFISSLSVPATASEEASTRFCWRSDNSPASRTSSTGPAKPLSGSNCETFAASGAPIRVPIEITRLEVQTSGRSTVLVEWSGVQVTIVPKNFSAQVEFVLPAPVPGSAPSEFTLRYTAGEPSR